MSELEASVDWDDRRYFLAVARATSLRKAADRLGVSRSTVLRRVSALEEALGVRLFERLQNGYFTTPAGDELLSSAERMEQEAIASARRLAGRDAQLTGKIRITMPGAFASHLLMPDLAAFSRAHPGITLDIAPDYSVVDLAKREADVAIRLTNDPPDDLVGRRILTIGKAGYVSKELLPDADDPSSAPPLTWIGWTDAPSSLQWVMETDYPDIPIETIVNDPVATLEAAKAGLGMALLPCFMGDAAPELYRLPPGKLLFHTDMWILTHEDLRKTARIRKFMDFMSDAILRRRDLLEGKNPRDLPTVSL